MPECYKTRQPCPTCPWRVDQDASVIPNFQLDLAEQLVATTSRELGAPVFACHHSKPGEELPCAGWLVVHGTHSITVRLMLLQGKLSRAALEPGEDWPLLHEDFEDVLDKLRRTAPGDNDDDGD